MYLFYVFGVLFLILRFLTFKVSLIKLKIDLRLHCIYLLYLLYLLTFTLKETKNWCCEMTNNTLKLHMTKQSWALTTVDLVRVVLAVRSTITEHRDRDTLITELARKLAWLTALHSHFPTTRGRRGHTAGGHQLISKSRRKGFILILMWKMWFSGFGKLRIFRSFFCDLVVDSVHFLTSPAAKDLHTQEEGVPELYRDDP